MNVNLNYPYSTSGVPYPYYGGADNQTTDWQDPNKQQCPRCYQMGIPIVWYGTVPPSCDYCGYNVGQPVFPQPYPWFEGRHRRHCHCNCHCDGCDCDYRCRCHRDWNPVQTNTVTLSTNANADEPKKEKEKTT